MPKTGLDLDQVIIVANNEGMPIKKRAIALKMLQKIGNPESLFTICSVASADQSQIALYSRKIVATFEYVQLEAILNYALESSEGHFVEKQILGFIHEARKQDLLRYLLGELGKAEPDPSKYRAIQRWIQDSHVIREYIRLILVVPVDIAKKVAKMLFQLDSSLVREFADIARSAPPTLCIRILDILSILFEGKRFPTVLLPLSNHADPKVKSKVASVVGKCSNNSVFYRRFLTDKDDRVRANAIGGMAEVDLEVIETTAIPYLDDKNQRVRANAAKLVYEYGSQRGLKTLLEMLDSPNLKMRISGAWVLGEVREIIAIDRLQALADEEASRGFPFRIDSELEADLSLETISKDLYAEMSRREVPISAAARLSVEQQGSKWVIADLDNSETHGCDTAW